MTQRPLPARRAAPTAEPLFDALATQPIKVPAIPVANDNHHARYSALSVRLHWLSVVSLTVGVGAILLREYVDTQSARAMLLTLHREVGLFMLLCVSLRAGARLRGPRHAGTREPNRLLRLLAVSTHSLIYAALFALPLQGWLLTNVRSMNVSIFGLGQLPHVLTADSDLADTFTDWHSYLAILLGVLVLMHVVAALWHHFVKKDGVLKAMMPR